MNRTFTSSILSLRSERIFRMSELSVREYATQKDV
jgi:hypothetical protein